MHRFQIQLGFVLLLIALLTGLGVPFFPVPRLGLAAHLAGITGGLVLIAVGALASAFTLGARAAAVMRWSWTYAAYANWFACTVGALTGASRLTPIAGAGHTGDEVSEAFVSFLLLSLAVSAIVGTGVAIYGLRKTERVGAGAAVAA